MTTAAKSIKIAPTAAAKKNAAAPATPAKKSTKETAIAAATPSDLITVTLPPNSRETARWMIAPQTDGHERWFDKTKIHAFTSLKDVKKGTGGTVTIRRAELSYRGKTFRGIAANA